MEWHHPVAGQQEIPVNVKVAAFIAVHLCTKSVHNFWLIEPFADPTNLLVAKRVLAAGNTYIIRILSSPLIWADDSVVAVDSGGNAGPNTFTVVATLYERLAARKRIIHRLALALINDSWPATFAASHWSIIFILCQAICETVPNQDRFQIDVPFLVAHDLGGEDRDIVPCI